MDQPITLLFIAAGKSSRFGGEPKMLSRIGPHNESLFEMSLTQVITSTITVSQIHLVVNNENKTRILDEVNCVVAKHRLNVNVSYNIQDIPDNRSKPWGTTDAVVSSKEFISSPFLLMNSNELYDVKTFELVKNICDFSKNYIIGFKLGTTLSNGKANRAFISVNATNGQVIELQERLNIEKTDYCEEELDTQYVSVNLFLLQPDVLGKLDTMLDMFKEENRSNNTIEAMLPEFLNSQIKNNNIKMKLVKSNGIWNGVTYKDDIEYVRKMIINSQ